MHNIVARRPHDLKLQAVLAETLDEAGAPESAERIYAAILRKDPADEAARRAARQLRQALDVGPKPLPKAPLLATDEQDVCARIEETRPGLRVKMGAVLFDEAWEWFDWAVRQGATAVYADHWGANGEARLQAGPHPLDLATNPYPPPVVMFAPGFLGQVEDLEAGLSRAFAQGRVVHVPLILSRFDAECEVEVYPNDNLAISFSALDRILVVIPTRNSVEELMVMLRSLVSMAARVDLLDIVVVDNGSCPSLDADALSQGCEASVEVMRVDEPFNWSRLNNLASVGRSQTLLVFANNDMEMLTFGWDKALWRAFSVQEVGVVGARLIYPHGLMQHGGIVMGALNGEPLHDGWRAQGDDPGPSHRWMRSRPATAVTGGFMAIERALFEAIGGFDEVDLPISCSDVDLCLKAGALGRTVLYSAEVEVRHHESLTRGHAHTTEAKRSAAREMQTLLDRWGERATYDPTRNPQWEARGLRLYAGRSVLTTEQVADWGLKTMWRGGDQRTTPTLA